MDSRIKKLINFTKAKLELDNYHLQRYSLDRNVNIFNDTVYLLCMEWFPNHVNEHVNDESNPKGTAVIDINIHSGKFESVIFVGGESYANIKIFYNDYIKETVKWIELETGLTFGEQFQLNKEEERALYFKACFEGVDVSPSGSIEVKFDQKGTLIFFAVHGPFPSKGMVKEETYNLSLEKIAHIAKEQVKLIEFPSMEQQQLLPIYGVEEVYIRNDNLSTIPFEFIVDVRSHLKINKTIEWNTSIKSAFERQEIQWSENVSNEQAFSCEPSPDSYPITMVEQEKCTEAVRNFLRQVYSNDTGKWKLKTLHRDKRYIHATLREKEQGNDVYQRKLTIIMDAKNYQAINYIDNKSFLEVFSQFQTIKQVTINKEDAYEKIREFFELKPYFVYDFEEKQYILCGKFDCHYGIDAAKGEMLVLDEI